MGMRSLRVLAATVIAVGLVSSGCGKDEPSATDKTPEQVMAFAKQQLDDTPGVHLHLETPSLPEEISGVVKADGTANHQPAFEGSIDLVYSGFTGTVPVVSVDGVVWAILPFTTKYAPVKPGEYGAPDPATLMDPAKGVSPWLTAATGLVKGDQVRDGSDVLTSYAGTLAGTSVASALPSAGGQGVFDATFTIDGDGRLRTASLTGPFYKGKPELTYNVTFTLYDTEKDITAP